MDNKNMTFKDRMKALKENPEFINGQAQPLFNSKDETVGDVITRPKRVRKVPFVKVYSTEDYPKKP